MSAATMMAAQWRDALRADGALVLQHCAACGAVAYPPRAVCAACLCDRLAWCETDPNGALLSWTEGHVAIEPFFAERTPWPIGRVRLVAGPVVLAHLATDARQRGAAVSVRMIQDHAGRVALVALDPTETVSTPTLRQDLFDR